MLKKLKQWLSNLLASSRAEDKNWLPNADHVGRPRLGVVVGHTRAAPGANLARPYIQSEYVFNSSVAQVMCDIVKEEKRPFDISVFFRDSGGIAGAYEQAIELGCDAVIELHFNAFDGKARGTETLCSSAEHDKEFALKFQRGMCSLFKREGLSRGVKVISRQDRGGFSVHAFPVGPNCLVEPVFGDEPGEAKMIAENKALYAKCLVDAFQDWAIGKGLINWK